jgi:parallel beta-helix repeat protein
VKLLRKKLWKKILVLVVGTLLTMVVFKTVIGAQLGKVSNNDKENNLNNYNEEEVYNASSFNKKLHTFLDFISVINENTHSNRLQDVDLEEYINEILSKNFSEIKEIAKAQIREMSLPANCGLSKEEMNRRLYMLISGMEGDGVTDDTSFLEVLNRLSSYDSSKNVNEDSFIHYGALVSSVGWGFAFSIPCKPFVPFRPDLCIGFPLVYGALWKYAADFPEHLNIPFKPFVNSYEISSGDLRFVEGEQAGLLIGLLGIFIRAGATLISQGFVAFIGGVFFIADIPIETQLPGQRLEKRTEDNDENCIVQSLRSCLNKHDKTMVNFNYLKSNKHPKIFLKSTSQNAYVPHDPIRIIGDEDFKKPVEVSGVVSGSGTKNNPYIIENWEIRSESATGITIKNTDSYFLINNCYIYGGRDTQKCGIFFNQVRNGEIINCDVTNNDDGIFLHNSSFIKVTNCKLFRNGGNIYLNKAKNCIISNCVSTESIAGMWISYDSLNNDITHCIFQNNFFGISFFFSSFNNRVTGCNISDNYFCGVLSVLCFDNKINYNNIYNNGWVGTVVAGGIEDATYNWWGSADGPGGEGPGNGDLIGWIDGTIIFHPWLNEPK